MSTDKKIIAVIGATGHQGVGLVRAILNEKNGEFAVRAITKDVNSESAKWLKKNNVDVRAADINNEDALVEAIKGCYGMYAITFYWQHMNPEEELRQARNLANAAKKVGLKHIVWSTLEDTREPLKNTNVPTLNEKYKVPPFDAKADADRFFSECGVPTTYFITPFYWENFIDMGMEPKKTAEGNYEIRLPMGNKRLAGMSSEDIGHCAFGIFKNPGEYANKRIGVMSEALTVNQIAEKMSKVMNKTIRYHEMSFDDYRHMTFPGAIVLGNMFQYYVECEDKVLNIRCPDTARKLYPNIMNFDQWLNKYKEQIPIRG